ncbi:MAG TPA: hypothetical protein VI702_06860 [Nitrospiria bacterium]
MSTQRLLYLFFCVILIAFSPEISHSADWTDDFERERLDSKFWQTTRSGDFKESKIDIVAPDPKSGPDRRLRLRADTLQTDDRTVKFLGVRSMREVPLKTGAEVSFDLDWNNQSNGSYLSAAFYLCPTITSKNPENEPDWIRIEYIGVPPGQNTRPAISVKSKGLVRWLYLEGWPETNKTGRRIGRVRLDIEIRTDSLVLREAGREIFRGTLSEVGFDRARIYLQMSSHSNYPAREIYFDNIRVRSMR